MFIQEMFYPNSQIKFVDLDENLQLRNVVIVGNVAVTFGLVFRHFYIYVVFMQLNPIFCGFHAVKQIFSGIHAVKPNFLRYSCS